MNNLGTLTYSSRSQTLKAILMVFRGVGIHCWTLLVRGSMTIQSGSRTSSISVFGRFSTHRKILLAEPQSMRRLLRGGSISVNQIETWFSCSHDLTSSIPGSQQTNVRYFDDIRFRTRDHHALRCIAEPRDGVHICHRCTDRVFTCSSQSIAMISSSFVATSIF